MYRLSGIVSSDLNIIPSNELNVFLTESNELSNTFIETQPIRGTMFYIHTAVILISWFLLKQKNKTTKK